eukprot:11321833-Alexandrium_andersonii.AAC.1
MNCQPNHSTIRGRGSKRAASFLQLPAASRSPLRAWSQTIREGKGTNLSSSAATGCAPACS